MGWNGSDRASGATPPPPPERKAPRKRRGLAAGVIVVASIAAALCLLTDRGDDPAPRREAKRPAKIAGKPHVTPVRAEVAPESVAAASSVARAGKPGTAPAKRAAEPVRAEEPADEPGETNAVAGADAKKVRKPVFENGVEQLLDMVMPDSPGTAVPPPPIVTDAQLKDELRRALDNIPKATEDDTEETIGRKLKVEALKDEFAELNRTEGVSITEYLKALREKNNADAEFMSEVHKVDDAVRADPQMTDEDCANARKHLNEKLAERGLPALGEDGE